MIRGKRTEQPPQTTLAKCPTGIKGLDEITNGGLPQGRPTLVYGRAGCGKTTLAMEFLARGATEFGEPGVLMTFEETAREMIENFTFFGLDLEKLIKDKKLSIDHATIETTEFVEIGSYDLDGLFVRLGQAIDSIGAKRVVLDSFDTLFAGLSNQGVLRLECKRLFRWLKEKGVTAIVTGEQAGNTLLTRHGLEDYLSDCVILLDHRVSEQVSTRRLRVVKYRGSGHGTNEYPFLITKGGFYVLPITSLGLAHQVSTERVSTGIEGLDRMMGQGYYRGSTILVSGTAGTGKSSIAAQFAHATCRRGERCLYFTFEESAAQIIRNMQSIGLGLEPYVEQGLLQFHAVRPTLYGLEAHLVNMYRLIAQFDPAVVIVDPITSLMNVGERYEVKITLVRLIDQLKGQQKTAMLTSLTEGGADIEQTDVDVSSLADTWLLVRSLESSGERNRVLYVIKSRGMVHSNQVREFHLTGKGIKLVEPYVGPEGLLTGAARLSQEARDEARAKERRQEIEQKRQELELKRTLVEAQIKTLWAEFEIEREELEKLIELREILSEAAAKDREKMAQLRGASSDEKVQKENG